MTRCKSCGFKIRGANHEEGSHHLSNSREQRGAVNHMTFKRRQPWSNAPKGWQPPKPTDD